MKTWVIINIACVLFFTAVTWSSVKPEFQTCPVPPEYRGLAVNLLIGAAVLAWYAGAVVWVRKNGWGDAWDKREDPVGTTAVRLLQVAFSPVIAPLWWFCLAARRLVLPKETK